MSRSTIALLTVLGSALCLAAVILPPWTRQSAIVGPAVTNASDAAVASGADSRPGLAPIQLAMQAVRFEEDDLSAVELEGVEGADISAMITKEDMYAYVKSQEPWAADDATFESKYGDMSVGQMIIAENLAAHFHRDEQTYWLDTMDLNGDYIVLRDADSGMPYKPELFGGAFSMRVRGGRDGARRYVFSRENYPFVQMRAREQRWLLERIMAGGGNPAWSNTKGNR